MDTQKAFRFDSITLEKIGKSFLVSLAGILLTSGTFLGQELLDWLNTGNVIDWRMALIMSLSALGAWVANTIKEWVSGEEVK